MLGILGALLSGGALKYVKYGLIAVALVGAFLYVRNMGVQGERAKWEKAALVEQGRQMRINEEMAIIGKEAADKLVFGELELEQRMEGAENEARNEVGTDTICLSPTGVMRLNSIR